MQPRLAEDDIHGGGKREELGADRVEAPATLTEMSRVCPVKGRVAGRLEIQTVGGASLSIEERSCSLGLWILMDVTLCVMLWKGVICGVHYRTRGPWRWGRERRHDKYLL